MFSKNSHKQRRQVDIVSFDIPYPPNYGGVIDVFYKIRALKNAGIGVNLHCFEYGRKKSQDLENLCDQVYYYKRNVSKANLFRKRPYIVVTRSAEELIANLSGTENPILFEGLHTCFYLDDKRLHKKNKIVRTHNIEHDYYLNLAKVEKDIFKRYYFSNEAQKLKHYEKILTHAEGIAAISKHDKNYFSSKFKNVKTISAFHPNENVEIEEGLGNYVLYHGSLSVGENNEAGLFLINQVFNDIDVPLVIAGNKPSKELRSAAEKHKNISLRTEITTAEIYKLIKGAQINILATFQSTGIKLKLLSSLYTGRHCIVNSPMVENTGLEPLCIIRDGADELKKAVLDYFAKPFLARDVAMRKKLLDNSSYSSSKNIHLLIEMLFP